MSAINLSEIRKQLPAGATKDIAKIAGVAEPTVSKFFRGNTKSRKFNEMKAATAKFISDLKAKEKETDEMILKALAE